MKFAVTFALAVLIIGTSAFAQDQKKDPCANAQTQLEMSMCWGKEYKAADAQMNKAYHGQAQSGRNNPTQNGTARLDKVSRRELRVRSGRVQRWLDSSNDRGHVSR